MILGESYVCPENKRITYGGSGSIIKHMEPDHISSSMAYNKNNNDNVRRQSSRSGITQNIHTQTPAIASFKKALIGQIIIIIFMKGKATELR